nr:hypothetical protein [Tanacetum cinerariifolium]
NYGNNDCVLVTLGGCLEQFRHSSIISHRNFWWRIFLKLVFKKWEFNSKRFNNNSLEDESWPLISLCACLDAILTLNYASKLVGLPTWHFKEVWEEDRGLLQAKKEKKNHVLRLGEEPSHTVEDSSIQQDQEFIMRDNHEQPTDKEGPKRQSFYGYASNMSSSKDVYFKRRIIAVTRLKIMKKYGYGHLEDTKVRQDDQKLYTFREGDFKRLRLQDIEDMLLLLFQQWLTNLTIDEQNKTAYTSYSDPHGIIYVDQYKRKRLMRVDELDKFNDGTLNDVRSALHDIVAGIRIEYQPMREWSNLDKKRAQIMVQDIDNQLYQRRLMRNLEKFIGGREFMNDLKLLERTI